MDSRDDDSLSSSLPSSLIPHLYTGPRQPQDSSTRTTLSDDFYRCQQLAPLEPRLPIVQVESAEAAQDRNTPSSALMGLAGAASLHQPPIYSDPAFHASTSRSHNLPRAPAYDTPSSRPPDFFAHRRTFRELEAGPSSRLTPPPRNDSQSRPHRASWHQGDTAQAPSPPPISRDEALLRPMRNTWREGEVGLSSMSVRDGSAWRQNQSTWAESSAASSSITLPREDNLWRNRRHSHQPSFSPPSEYLGRGSNPIGAETRRDFDGSRSAELNRRTSEGGSSAPMPGHPSQTYTLQSPHSAQSSSFTSRFPASPPSRIPIPEPPSGSRLHPLSPSHLHTSTVPYSGSASTSTAHRGASPEMHPPNFNTFGGYPEDRSGGRLVATQKGKKLRDEATDNIRRSKTPVACNFCRARKLKCDGGNPCGNCAQRKYECDYAPYQRRRGPGKAPKGSRSKSKKRMGATSATSTTPTAQGRTPTSAGPNLFSTSTERPPGQVVPSHELDAIAPELRPYTSVISLDSFSFHPPEEAPRYPSSPLRTQSGSRARTPRSRETSSEDRSDAEEVDKKMG